MVTTPFRREINYRQTMNSRLVLSDFNGLWGRKVPPDRLASPEWRSNPSIVLIVLAILYFLGGEEILVEAGPELLD